jgi:hypothetical protein
MNDISFGKKNMRGIFMLAGNKLLAKILVA